MPYSKKIVALAPTTLALLLYTLSYSGYGGEQQAERAFEIFSLRFNQRQYSPAQKDIERAVSLSPKSAYYLASQGLLLARMSQRRFDSTSFLEKRLTFNEEELKGLDAAAHYYQQSLELNPLDDSGYHNLGWVRSLLRQREQALRCFQKAISIDGSIALYHISLGLWYEQGGENENAYHQYELAVRLSPTVLDSQFFHELSGRSREAADRVVERSISHFEGQPGRDRNPILKSKLGKLYLYVNLLDKASAALREAVGELPSLPRPWHNLGAVYEKQGDETAMKECYQRATFLDGGDALAWSKLGDLHNRHNNKHETIRSYAQAIRSWMTMTSEHAGRASRIYHTRFVVFDDVVPNGFLSYCSPSINVSEICQILAKLYDETGDRGLSNYYKGLSVRLAL